MMRHTYEFLTKLRRRTNELVVDVLSHVRDNTETQLTTFSFITSPSTNRQGTLNIYGHAL